MFRYCVRPNASTIAPGEKIEVQIILQGMKQEPPANYKCTDKFMVVSLPCPYEVTGEDAPTVAQIWPKLEKEFKRSEKKIRVIFKNTGAAKRTTPVASEPVIAKENIPVAEPVAAPVKDKDLTESQKKIDQLNEKLDVEATKPAPEVGAVTSGAKTTSSAVTPQASSLPVPLAILGGLIALILAWLFF